MNPLVAMQEEKISDSWRTPDWLFDELNKEFSFNIDLCATEENSKCGVAYCEDYLNDSMSIKGGSGCSLKYLIHIGDIKTAFMNPPYSNPKPFIEKAWEDSKYCKIVCLVKCDPSTKWWAVFWEYGERHACEDDMCSDKWPCNDFHTRYHGPKPGCEVRFFPKRIQFDPPRRLIDSGEVRKVGNKWVQKCKTCLGHKVFGLDTGEMCTDRCFECNSKGYKPLSGPTFPCALVIMDRRNV